MTPVAAFPAPAPAEEEPLQQSIELDTVCVEADELPSKEPAEAGSPGAEAMSAALQSSRKEKEPLAAVENKQIPAHAPPRVVNAKEAVKWQSAAGASIPVMSVIR